MTYHQPLFYVYVGLSGRTRVVVWPKRWKLCNFLSESLLISKGITKWIMEGVLYSYKQLIGIQNKADSQFKIECKAHLFYLIIISPHRSKLDFLFFFLVIVGVDTERAVFFFPRART